MPTIKEWFRTKVLKMTGLSKYNGPAEENSLTYINNKERLTRSRIREYNIWYEGDGDELLNYYTGQNMFDYNYEPWYSRNKKSYFWSINSTENDIKRTHSGQARNIVDTLVSIMHFPIIKAGAIADKKNVVNQNMQEMIKKCRLKSLYKQEQMPLTLVEGWGCYKINWDEEISDWPIPVYYRAENVDFIYKMGIICGVVFKDYYTDGKNRRYMLTETRRLGKTESGKTGLIIEKELFKTSGPGVEDYVIKAEFKDVPELADMTEADTYIEIEGCKILLAVPCILFKNTSNLGGYGRSIFTGKIDLFDDLDQALSQAANAVRKSTPIEYFNSEFLERDDNGLVKQPNAYDRKYVVFRGAKNADGSSTGEAIQTTQPSIDFKQYSDEAIAILLQIINGILSPATLGIDIAKKDNAEAQREKEKVTIFTRNNIIETESEILKDLCSQLLCAKQLMDTGMMTVQDYEISVQFSEFADDSFENKIEKLGAAFDAENISEEMYMKKLYGDTLTDADYETELQWLKDTHTKHREDAYKGAAGGGVNMPGMLNNMTGGADDEEEI